MRLTITGHRPQKLYTNGWQGVKEGFPILVEFYEKLLTKMREEQGVTELVSGMALGVDQAAAQAAINIGLPVIAVIPFKDQPNVWRHEDKVRYNSILVDAKEIITLQTARPRTNYEAARWLNERNHYMVDMCDTVLAMWDGSPGGTGNCVKYAQTKNVKILNAWKSWVNYRDANLR